MLDVKQTTEENSTTTLLQKCETMHKDNALVVKMKCVFEDDLNLQSETSIKLNKTKPHENH